MVRIIVGGQFVLDLVQSESALSDAVSVATNDGTEVRRFFQIARKIIVAENDVAEVTVPVGSHDRQNDATVVKHPDFNATRVCELENVDYCSVTHCGKFILGHGCSLSIGRFGCGTYTIGYFPTRSKAQTGSADDDDKAK